MHKRLFQISTMIYALLFALIFVYYNHRFYHDDAYITLRYASNWIAGNGVVWNPGEFIQGYTNFLHLIFIALLGWFGIDLVWASRIIGFTSVVGLFGIMSLFGKTTAKQSRLCVWHIPAILVVTAAPILVWSLGGLEGSLFAFLVAGSCLLFLAATQSREKPRFYFASGFFGGLCILVRPDGIVFIAASIAWLSWLILKNKTKEYSYFLAYLTGVTLVVLPYMIWQLHYYGDIVPNAFYAKTGAPLWLRVSTGIRYIFNYFFTPPFLFILLGSSLAWTVLMRRWNTSLTYLALMISSYLAFIIWAGGDHMQSFRFLVPVIPLMSVMLTMSLQFSIDYDRRVVVSFITVAILILSTMQLLERELNPKNEDAASHIGTIVGKHIAQAWPTGSLIALNTAGSTPYYADSHRYIDMLGLNDSTIAKRKIDKVQLPWQRVPGHLKGDGRYVLSRRPDYIIVGPAEGTLVSKPWFLSDLELSRDPQFYHNYAAFSMSLNPENGNMISNGGLLFTFYKRVGDQEGSEAVQQPVRADGATHRR